MLLFTLKLGHRELQRGAAPEEKTKLPIELVTCQANEGKT